MESPELTRIRERLARRWQSPDLSALANRATAQFIGVPGDWDPPQGVVAKRPPLSLAVGIPDASALPREQLNEAMRQVLAEEDDASLRYGFGLGFELLRAAVAAHYQELHGGDVNQEWVQITNGASGAIDLLLRSMIEPDDVILCDTPVYMGTLRNFRAMRADIRPVPVDADGMNVGRLRELLEGLRHEGRRVRMLYTIASFQNPTGATLSMERRLQLLALAAEHGFLIIDDEAYAELYYHAEPMPSLLSLSEGYGVVSVGTHSKTIATGLRIGWVMARPELISLITKMRFDMGQNQMGVRMMANFLNSGAMPPHLQAIRELYRRKMNRFADALSVEAGDWVSFVRPQGGFYLWLQLRSPLRANDVWRLAAEEGVNVNDGRGFKAGSEPPGEFLRTAFAWTAEADLEEAARRLGIACRRAAGDS